MHFRIPFRKVILVLKLCYLIVIFWLFLVINQQDIGDTQKIFEFYNSRYVRVDHLKTLPQFEKDIWRDNLKIIWDYGANGFGVKLDHMARKCGEDSVMIHGYNIVVSARIPLKRRIRDLRHPTCSQVIYDKELPTVSVIIAFRNVPLSILLRTIWTVIPEAKSPMHDHSNHNSSCFLPLKEIILVDDSSTSTELKGKLGHYVRTRLPPYLVQILRLTKSLGPLRAKLAGARHASAEVLLFLDPHSEGQEDWLRPLLHRIKQTRTAVVMPQIDQIDAVDFEYVAGKELMVGGFSFGGSLHWIPWSQRDNEHRDSEIAPIRSPAIKGGTFAIDRKYFWELGGFDPKEVVWGEDDVEVSLRLWQCGATIEVIPCSRVGLLNNKIDQTESWEVNQHINAAITAEVWLDEYKELLYLHWPQLRNITIFREVIKRRKLRDSLNCNSFQWYLDSVYKPKFIPVRDTVAFGRLFNPRLRICLEKQKGDVFGSKCRKSPRVGQFITLSLDGILRDELDCIRLRQRPDATEDSGEQYLESVRCDEHENEKWVYMATGQLLHVTSGLCLSSSLASLKLATLTPCRPGAPQQKWSFDYVEKDGNVVTGDNNIPREQEERLQYIRKQRRHFTHWDPKDIFQKILKNMTGKYSILRISHYRAPSNDYKRTQEFTRR